MQPKLIKPRSSTLQVDSLPSAPPGEPKISQYSGLYRWQVQDAWGFPGGANGKEPACQHRRHETRVPSLGQEDPLEEGMATHSSIIFFFFSFFPFFFFLFVVDFVIH